VSLKKASSETTLSSRTLDLLQHAQGRNAEPILDFESIERVREAIEQRQHRAI
jgi:hypothetical protein